MRVEQALVYFKRKRDTIQLIEEDLAIWALEKQMPKKPVKVRYEIVCPTCKTLVGSSPYCRYCVQSLDWSEVKE